MRMRTPGVYQALDERKLVPVTLGPTGVAGFVGLAQRGPTNAPVRVTSLEQFRAVYGQMEDEGYLAPAIQGFFDNGGQVCYVLRVAHLVRRAREEVARAAHLKLLDEKGNETVRLTAATRDPEKYGIADLAKFITFGASPRATIHLIESARALAFLRGRDYVLPQEVVDLAPDVFRHRIVLSYEALAESLTADQIILRIMDNVPAPEKPLEAHFANAI